MATKNGLELNIELVKNNVNYEIKSIIKRLKKIKRSYKNYELSKSIENLDYVLQEAEFSVYYKVTLLHKKTGVCDTLLSSEYPSHSKIKILYNTIKYEVQRKREEYRTFKGVYRYSNINYKITQRKPNYYLKQQLKKNLIAYREDKKPATKNKHIGIELEFISDANSWLNFAMKMHELDVNLIKKVQIKGDGSIRTTENTKGYEIAIIDTERNISSTLKTVLSVIHCYNSTVNFSCGVHVHLDCRTRDVPTTYENLTKAQKFFFKMQPESRRTNGYCSRSRLKYTGRTRKYKAISTNTMYRHSTIEVRIHAGSLNFTKINNWVKLLTKIADNKEIPKMQRSPNKFDNFAKKIKLTKDLTDYVNERIMTHAS